MGLKSGIVKYVFPTYSNTIKFLYNKKFIKSHVNIKVGRKELSCAPQLSRKLLEEKIRDYHSSRE